jgi:cytochrome P450
MAFNELARYFTLDVLSTVAFGKPFGFIAANDDLWDYGKLGEQFLLVLALCLNHRTARSIFFSKWFQDLAGPKPTDKVGMGALMGFARKAVAERFGPDRKVKKDMLGHFVEKGLPQLQCEVEAVLQILAGSDSTTTVLRCTLFTLIGNPTAYSKLKAEIDEAIAAGSLSSPIQYSEAQKLPYLSACLWEGLRMFPPLFGLKGKYSPKGGESFKGVFYPEGIEMGICDEAMCRDKNVFGADSHIYRPDRWIEADEDTRKRYTRVTDTIFGTGRFQCLGKHIANMELHKTLVEVSSGGR